MQPATASVNDLECTVGGWTQSVIQTTGRSVFSEFVIFSAKTFTSKWNVECDNTHLMRYVCATNRSVGTAAGFSRITLMKKKNTVSGCVCVCVCVCWGGEWGGV